MISKYPKNQHVHFVGIGGIGMSALAQYYKAHGATVTGSDMMPSEITRALSLSGIPVIIGGARAENLPAGVDKVIYTAAAKRTNGELVSARKKHIPLRTYAESIGELTRNYKTITVSGAHGKSTTTAMIALVLEEGYCDPTVIVGTKMEEFGNTNFRKGYGTYLLVEADEYNRSFLKYSPHIAVITNIDSEHLDTYKTIEGVEKAFSDYLKKVPEGGAIVANADDARVKKIGSAYGDTVRWYSLASPEARHMRKILKVPGDHNISNALAALHVGRLLGISDTATMKALASFSGTWRRFEFSGSRNGAFLFSDYAHHPKEIHATIMAARNRFPFRRIWCIFQPHQHRRLAALWDDFISAFDMADRVTLAPVYDVAGRETKKARAAANSEKLAAALSLRGKNVDHVTSLDDIPSRINRFARAGDVILLMGAGDIYNVSRVWE